MEQLEHEVGVDAVAADYRSSITSLPAWYRSAPCPRAIDRSWSASSTGAGDMHLVMRAVRCAVEPSAAGLALRKRFCRNFNFELQAAAAAGCDRPFARQHAQLPAR